MASLKGATSLWKAATVGQNDKSALAYIGPGPWVAVYIENAGTHDATFKIQVSATDAPEAGRNALDATADGGLTWYDFTDSHGVALDSLAVAAGATASFDLSPFAPPYIRLVRTDATGADEITAFVSCFGPN